MCVGALLSFTSQLNPWRTLQPLALPPKTTTTQELKEALDALGFGNASTNSNSKQQQTNGNGVEGFTSATFPELALLCR